MVVIKQVMLVIKRHSVYYFEFIYIKVNTAPYRPQYLLLRKYLLEIERAVKEF